jgi:hypothetical protein
LFLPRTHCGSTDSEPMTSVGSSGFADRIAIRAYREIRFQERLLKVLGRLTKKRSLLKLSTIIFINSIDSLAFDHFL